MTVPYIPPSDDEELTRRRALAALSQMMAARPDVTRAANPSYDTLVSLRSRPVPTIGPRTSGADYPMPPEPSAFERYAPAVGEFVARLNPAIDIPMSTVEFGQSAIKGDLPGMGLAALSFLPLVGSLKNVGKGAQIAEEVRAADEALQSLVRSAERVPSRAPAIISRDQWQPTSRGIFERGRFPDMQGTVASDPRLVAPVGPKATSSIVTDAIATSPVVRAGLRSDAERGLQMGAGGWYDFSPIRRYIEERGTPETLSFADFNHLGAGSSMQNSVPSEISDRKSTRLNSSH